MSRSKLEFQWSQTSSAKRDSSVKKSTLFPQQGNLIKQLYALEKSKFDDFCTNFQTFLNKFFSTGDLVSGFDDICF